MAPAAFIPVSTSSRSTPPWPKKKHSVNCLHRQILSPLSTIERRPWLPGCTFRLTRKIRKRNPDEMFSDDQSEWKKLSMETTKISGMNLSSSTQTGPNGPVRLREAPRRAVLCFEPFPFFKDLYYFGRYFSIEVKLRISYFS